MKKIEPVTKFIKRTFTLNKSSNEPISKKTILNTKECYLIECQVNSFNLREELKCYKLEQGDHIKIMGG